VLLTVLCTGGVNSQAETAESSRLFVHLLVISVFVNNTRYFVGIYATEVDQTDIG
jgi:hypothetical protein